jgi:hypothetical protein
MAHMIPPAESGGKSVPTAIAQVVAQLLDEGIACSLRAAFESPQA